MGQRVEWDMNEKETERIERKFSDNEMIMRGLERDIARRQKTDREQRERKMMRMGQTDGREIFENETKK